MNDYNSFIIPISRLECIIISIMELSTQVNLSVFAFFIINTILIAYLAFIYLRQKKSTFKLFGVGLGLNAIAFLFWSYITGFRPENLTIVTSVGVLFFIGAFIAFFASSIAHLKPKDRVKPYVLGVLLLAILVALRFIFYQSHPGFSDTGFFSFNTQQIVLYAYVVTLALTVAPAAFAVSQQVKNATLAYIIRFGFTIVVIGTAILITSPDNELQVINGVGMTAAFFILAVAQTILKLDAKK